MQWCLVTGGAKRLGASICRFLAAQGKPVIIHYRRSEREAVQVADVCRSYGSEAEIIHGDFSSRKSTHAFIERCFQRFPCIKTLINNVGEYQLKSALETTSEEWEELFQLNLHAPFALCKAYAPALKECRGTILNIGAAGVNNVHADVRCTAYSASKTALLMLTKSLARELASSHVRVNMVSPGYLADAVDLSGNEHKLLSGKPCSHEDILKAIEFLLDDSNAQVTGQNIEVSGGVALLR